MDWRLDVVNDLGGGGSWSIFVSTRDNQMFTSWEKREESDSSLEPEPESLLIHYKNRNNENQDHF